MLMQVKITMCHSNLMSILLQPEEFQVCVSSYTATSPDVAMEGMNGYMETIVTFEVKDLVRFGKLYEASYVFPSDRSKWYASVKKGLLSCGTK